jgi:hypothetical protein
MMKKILSGVSVGTSVWLLPFVALAQNTGNGTITGVVQSVGTAVGAAVPVAAALVLVAFFWGLAMYLFNFGEGKDDKQKQGRNLMIYSVLALFVMVTIWGIVGLLANSFGISQSATADAPLLDNITPGGGYRQ